MRNNGILRQTWLLAVGMLSIVVAVGGCALASRQSQSASAGSPAPAAVQVNRFGQDPSAQIGRVAISGDCGDVTEAVTQAARAGERLLSFGAVDEVSMKYFAGDTDAMVLLNEFAQRLVIPSAEVRSELDDLYSGELLTSMVEAAASDSSNSGPRAAINLGGTIHGVEIATGECDADHAELELVIDVTNATIPTETGVDAAWSITTSTATVRVAVSLLRSADTWLVGRFSVIETN